MVTGESHLMPKTTGSSVIGGTLNQNSVLEMIASSTGSTTTIATIVRLVEDAQTSKPRAQILADVLASYCTLAMIIYALVMSIIVGYVDGPGFSFSLALRVGVSLLMVSCPGTLLSCAVSPVTMVASGVGAKAGVLLRRAQVLETLPQVDTFVFDKTGTLTRGSFDVVDVLLTSSPSTSNDDDDDDDDDTKPKKTTDRDWFWTVVASVESESDHPLARAIQRHVVEDLGLTKVVPISNFKSDTGLGVQCDVVLDDDDGKSSQHVCVGTWRYVQSMMTNGQRFESTEYYSHVTIVNLEHSTHETLNIVHVVISIMPMNDHEGHEGS